MNAVLSTTPLKRHFRDAHVVYLNESTKLGDPAQPSAALRYMKLLVKRDLVYPTSPAPRVLLNAIKSTDIIPCDLALKRLYEIRHGENNVS